MLATGLALTTSAYVLGAVTAVIVGLSKTALPGTALLATPIIASVFEGRLIAGATLPILLVADVFAVNWYRDSARWDLLKPLTPWVGLGFAVGATFFVIVGKASRPLNIAIGTCVLAMVVLQAWRMARRTPPAEPTTGAAAFHGAAGGLTTFVSNNAGPIMNAHFLRLGLDKHQLIGTSSWFYFAVNVAKVPVYLALQFADSDGGPFFTAQSLRFDLVLVPVVIGALLVGRRLFNVIPQRTFLVVVLVLAAASSLKLLFDL